MRKSPQFYHLIINKHTDNRKKCLLGKLCYKMIQMLEAVQFIHRRRIIHADIKPDNFIMVRGHLKVK